MQTFEIRPLVLNILFVVGDEDRDSAPKNSVLIDGILPRLHQAAMNDDDPGSRDPAPAYLHFAPPL
jgi:hypothetical protein